ncbi:MAG: right-handed parallel beta-helix repeat-containing protein [Oligoflexia bacterium]|nr:right-handed parallel beta-helix repeat-containing protein [Oligoflexia bacterium]
MWSSGKNYYQICMDRINIFYSMSVAVTIIRQFIFMLMPVIILGMVTTFVTGCTVKIGGIEDRFGEVSINAIPAASINIIRGIIPVSAVTSTLKSKSNTMTTSITAKDITIVYLHELDENGVRSANPIQTTTSKSDGSFEFILTDAQAQLLIQNESIKYLIKADNADGNEALVDRIGEVIKVNNSSTVISNLVSGNCSLKRSIINTIMRDVSEKSTNVTASSASSASSASAALVADLENDQKLQSYFKQICNNKDVSTLRIEPPRVSLVTDPGTVYANQDNIFSVDVRHFDPNYGSIYVAWKINGVIVSTQAQFIYSPSEDQIGPQVISYVVGRKASNGTLDTSVPVREVTYTTAFVLPNVAHLTGTAPLVTLVIPDGTATNARTATLLINFNEEVTGLSLDDFSITNGDISRLSGQGASYTATVTALDAGEITIVLLTNRVKNSKGIYNQLTTTSLYYDPNAPVPIISVSGNSDALGPVVYTVNFDEDPIGFSSADVTFTNATLMSFSGSGKVYTITANPSTTGSIGITIRSDAFTDFLGNANTSSTTALFTYETNPPLPIITTSSVSSTLLGPITYTVTFDEVPIGFDSADLTLTNAGLASFAGSGTTYTITVNPSALGTVGLSIRSGAFTDILGNVNTTSTSASSITINPLTIVPLYPKTVGGTQATWNYYVKTSTPLVACSATGSLNYNECLNSGEYFKVEITGVSSCDGLTMVDSANVFEWGCSVSGGTAIFTTRGFKSGMGISDLINYNAAPTTLTWNNVSVALSGSKIGYSVARSLFTNALTEAPTGGGTLSTAETIYVVSSARSVNYYYLLSTTGLVVKKGVTLSHDGGTVANCNSWHLFLASPDVVCFITTSFNNYTWVEGIFDGNGANKPEYIYSSIGYFHTLHNATLVGGKYGIKSSGHAITLQSCRYQNISISNAVTAGHSTYVSRCLFNNFTIANNTGNGFSMLSGSTGNTVSNFSIHDNTGLALYTWNASNSSVHDIHAYKNTTGGISFNAGGNNLFYNINSHHNGGVGIYLYAAVGQNIIRNSKSQFNTSHGIYIYTNTSGFLTDVLVTNNGGAGIYFQDTSKDALLRAVSNNNASYGLYINNSTEIVASNSLFANNRSDGVRLASSASRNTLHNLIVANSYYHGLYILNNSSNNTVSHLASQYGNATGLGGVYYNISLSATPNKFSGLLLLEQDPSNIANTKDCGSLGPTYGLVNQTCANGGGSDATLVPAATLANSFIGKIIDDDTHQGLSSMANYPADPTLVDWYNFDNFYRYWAMSPIGVNFPSGSILSTWQSSPAIPGHIWDWSLSSSDTTLLNRAGDTYAIDGLCGSEVNGNDPSVIATDTMNFTYASGRNGIEGSAGNANGICESGETCNNQYLLNAYEIMDDGIGDDDALCESNEACVYTPNIGHYQGSGNIAGQCTFNGGVITGVTMYVRSSAL